MTTSYQWRFFIFVIINKTNTANNMAQAWDPDDDGSDTFGSVLLSPSGELPATHTACNTAATDIMKTGIEIAFTVVPWAGMYKVSDGWTWETAVDDMGLQVIG